jgi:N-acetylgalactosamine-6-sulfatase
VVRWPGRVKAGRRDDQSVITGVDWLPTVCKLAGADIGDIKPDGEDVSDMLTGTARARKKAIFWEWRGGIAGKHQAYRPPTLAIREGKWKFFVNPDGSRGELYDIPADGQERSNLASKHPEIAGRLKKKLMAWKKTLPK